MSGRRGHGRVGRLSAGTGTGETGTMAPAAPATAGLDGTIGGMAAPTAQAPALTATAVAPAPLLSPGGADKIKQHYQ